MTRAAAPLPDRFREHLRSLGLASPDLHLLVGVSGGADSVVLLHLLRFLDAASRPRLTAVHLDHRMRDGSDADARWVQGLCRAWEVPLVVAAACAPLRSEEEARRERYRVLRSAAAAVGATHLLTAHHADDQAETVLFRALRGTGVEGLAGIPATGRGGVVRPLLPFWRAELRAHARAHRLRWRTDPTNRAPGAARNRVRHLLLPAAERLVAPRARRNLVRLATLAREAEEGWAALVAERVGEVARADGDAVLLARPPFRRYHPALGSRLIRFVLRRFGIAPSGPGTRMALQFITDAPSGRLLELPGGVRLAAEFDTVRVHRASPTTPDSEVLVPGPEGSGGGLLRLGGRSFHVVWGREPAGADGWTAELDAARLRFPLRLRAWRPGDRIRLPGGTRRLKRLFGDRRVPRAERGSRPLLVDADDAVLWVAGLARAHDAAPVPGRDAFILTISHGPDR